MPTDLQAHVGPLFEPFQIRGLTLPNRFVMSPMTRCFSPNGVPGPDVAAYYRRRIDGETGLIITEGVGVDHPAALGNASLGERNVPHMYGEAALAGWRLVVDQVHAVGGKIIPQLWHLGVMRLDGVEGATDILSSRPSGVWGPFGRNSTVRPKYLEQVRATTRPMTDAEVVEVIDGYVRSARHAADCGFDGIAIHAAHGYLPDSFLWSETNTRTDRWGGDRAQRTRFIVEIVRRIRSEVGHRLPIFLRFSQWKQQDYDAKLATTPAELESILGPIADAGVDVFDASARLFDTAAFDGSPLNLAGWAKKLTGRPSMTVGGVGLSNGFYDSRREGGAAAVNNLTALSERFARGEFDLVAVGRSLLQDANWVRKARLGEPFEPYSEQATKVLL